MMIDDLNYLSIISEQPLMPSTSLEENQNCAITPIALNTLVGRFGCYQNQKEYFINNDIKELWLSNIMKMPLQYIQFRLSAFSYLLRSPISDPYFVWYGEIESNDFGITKTPSPFTKYIAASVSYTLKYTPFFFKPYWWLWISMIMFCATFIFRLPKNAVLIRCLLISSIFYIGSYVPTTPLADFRYIYWSALATSLAGAIALTELKYLPKITKSNSYILVTMILITIISFNSHKLLTINTSEITINSISTHPINIESTPATDDISKIELHANQNISKIRILKFNLNCLEYNRIPRLDITWQYAGETSEFDKNNHISIMAYKGINAIPLPPSDAEIQSIQITQSTPESCRGMQITDFVGYP